MRTCSWLFGLFFLSFGIGGQGWTADPPPPRTGAGIYGCQAMVNATLQINGKTGKHTPDVQTISDNGYYTNPDTGEVIDVGFVQILTSDKAPFPDYCYAPLYAPGQNGRISANVSSSEGFAKQWNSTNEQWEEFTRFICYGYNQDLDNPTIPAPWYSSRSFPVLGVNEDSPSYEFSANFAGAYKTEEGIPSPAQLNAQQQDPGGSSTVITARLHRALIRHQWVNYNPPWSTSGFYKLGEACPRDSWPTQYPGWVNGFDADPSLGVPAANIGVPDGVAISDLQLIYINVPGHRFEMNLEYEGSDPSAITKTAEGKLKLPEGRVRLWNIPTDGWPKRTNRKKASVEAAVPGEYVPPGTYTQDSKLFGGPPSTPSESRSISLHIEGVRAGPALFTVTVHSSWTDANGVNHDFTTSDKVVVNITAPGPGTCDCGVEGQYEDSSSVIDNTRLTYRHEADDYAPASGSSGCGPCGGSALGSTGGTNRPSLRLHRLHRYDLSDWPSSFGPGVFLSYDLRLRQKPVDSSASWSLWDPARHQVIELTWAGDNLLHDQVQGAIRSVGLYNAAGQAVSYNDPTMVRARLTEFDGRTVDFDLIAAPAGDPAAQKYGRPTRLADARGQAVTIAYAYPRTAVAGDLGGDLAQLWKIASITDAYGLSAYPGYRASPVGAYPTVATIAIPPAGTLSYGYRTTGPLPGLASVAQLDGSTTTVDVAAVAGADEADVTFNDPMADGMHRSKIVTLSTPTIIGLPVGRVRQVRKASGEVVYKGLATGDEEGRNVTLVQDGERVYRYVTDNGKPVRVDYLKTGTFATAMASGTWETSRSWAADGLNRITGSVDGLGQSIQTERDPVTGHPTKITYPDTTFETFQYDANGNQVYHKDRLNRVTTATYDLATNNRLTTTDADNAVRSWTYDPVTGALLSATDPRGGVTLYSYNAKGQLVRVEEPADLPNGVRPATTFGYDALNRLQWSQDQAGRQVTYGYDARNRLVLTTYADTSTEQVVYGTGADAGRVVSRIDRNGFTTTVAYDSAGRQIGTSQTVQQAPGVTETVGESATYFPGSELESSRRQRGETTVFTYDAQRRRIAQTVYATKTKTLTTSWTYDAAGRQAAETDAFGRRTFSVYDSDDRRVRTIRETLPGAVVNGTNLVTLARDTAANPAYVIEDVSYDFEGQVTFRYDGRNLVTAYTYDADGRVATQTEAYGTALAGTTTFVYDKAGNQIRVERPRHLSESASGPFQTVSTYTGRNLLLSQTEGAGRAEQGTTLYTYTADRKQATVTDPNGNTTLYRYGTCCARLKEVEDPTGALTTYAYDFVGHTTGMTDANLLTTATTYDELGRPKTRTNAKNETSTYTYDDNLTDGIGLDATYASQIAGLGFGYDAITGYGADGSATLVKDPLGNATLSISDGLGRVIKTVDPLGHATTMAYDQLVNETFVNRDASTQVMALVQTTVTDALGHGSSRLTDGLGLVRVQIDALGKKARMGYDANGNQVWSRDANGVGQDATFDARNRLATTQDTLGTPRTGSMLYDTEGNLVSRTDGLGKVELFTYDARNRKGTQTDRINAATLFSYDAVGNLRTIQDAEGGVTTYTYDKRNLLVRETFPGPTGGTRIYTYDAGRRLKTRTELLTSQAGTGN